MSRRIMTLVVLLICLLVVAGCSSAEQPEAERPSDLSAETPATRIPAATDTPAAAAVEGFDCTAVSEIPAAECQALVNFYQATGGPNWVDGSGWLESDTPCTWFGVTCVDGHIDTLGLYYNNLQGQLPATLADLARLRVLDLHNNQIGGSIPVVLGRLSDLEYLDLSSNQLDGAVPAELSALAKMQGLNLADNKLGGPIPAELGQLVSLRNLDLSHNQLSGAIPDSLAGAAALETIRLGHNILSGAIPFGLGQLPNLAEASLAFNQLTGPAPSALFELPVHQLWGNQLDGTIYAGQDVNYLGASFAFDEATADSVWPELVPARPAEPGPGILWAPPEHIVFTLVAAEPQQHNPMGLYVPAEAQIQIYPVAGLNEEVQPIVDGLTELLADRPDPATFEATLPEAGTVQPGMAMLPPSNAVQMFGSQAAYLDFAGGSGVRYLTQLAQGPIPVNNQDLFYTFQGLTSDGATYVAAYFPVSLPGLPDSQQVNEAEFAALVEDHAAYLAETAGMLDAQPASAFTPDLAALDALISSLSVAGTTPPPVITGEGIWPEDGESVDAQPVLQWAAVPEATSYQVVVLDDVAFPPVVVIDETVTEPLLAVEQPLAPGHYSWTVLALAENGTVLAELNRTFLVKDSITLVAPAAEAEVAPDVLLEWASFPGVVSYQVIVIDDDAYPPMVVADLKTGESSMQLPTSLEPGSYSWTVLAYDENGQIVAELTSNFVVAES